MTPVLTSATGVTLIGGGQVAPQALAAALALAPVVMAADSGADTALAHGQGPAAVVGDLDSISNAGRRELADVLHPVAEQDSTDFEKCLTRIAAPFVIAVGFSGSRLDHTLAALNALVRRVGPPTVLLAGADAMLACPRRVSADLPAGTRVSLFPMGQATASGTGLRWPVDGIDFAPDGRIGTSNEITGPLDLTVTGPMLLILPAANLATAVEIARG